MKPPPFARALLTASFVAAASAGATACGGEDRGRPQPTNETVAPVDYCGLEDELDLQPIVEFEPGAFPNARCDAGITSTEETVLPRPTSCSFFFNYDEALSLNEGEMTPCAQPVTPDGFATFVPEVGMAVPGEPMPDARCEDTESAFHFRGVNIGMCYSPLTGRLGWGGGVEVTFASAIDVSAWEGFSFWARRGDASSLDALLFTVSDLNTFGDATATSPCSVSETAADTEKCDAFGVNVTLSDEWRYVRVRFDAMRQKGFGKVSAAPLLDSTAVKRIQILFSAGNWDFWFDDIALYRSTGTDE